MPPPPAVVGYIQESITARGQSLLRPYSRAMASRSLFDELSALLRSAGLEIRTESFKNPPDSAGGFCRIRGKNLVLLHSGASPAERASALIEVVEQVGLDHLGAKGVDLSPELLARLNRRGQMSWPHKSDAPPIAKTDTTAPADLRLVHPDHKLSRYTTMGLGGEANSFVRAQKTTDVVDAVRQTNDQETPLFVLGGGSNLVVADAGVQGTVLKIELRGIEVRSKRDVVLVTVGAGENWHDFAQQMTAAHFAGVECLGGIPGSVGATPIQNVGAYGQEVSQTIQSVTVLDRNTLEVKKLSNKKCAFSYRSSVFKRSSKDRYIVLTVTFSLRPDGRPCIRNGELSRTLEAQGDAHSLQDVFDTVVNLRRKKSMVFDPADENSRSCGSFFVNAQVTEAIFQQISQEFGAPPPHFPGEKGLIKIPSAWLIEQSGFPKGYSIGGAVGLSTKHTLALVSHSGASATELVTFARHIRQKVEERMHVRLAPEPNFWGFSPLSDGLPSL